MSLLSTVFNLRYALITWPAILIATLIPLMVAFPGQIWWLLPFAAVCLASVLVGLHDLRQTRHAVLRNYPVAAHLRFLLEGIRPEMRQYFFEGDKDGTPFARDARAVVYQRAKKELDKRPFGTQHDVYREQYEWLHHSIAPSAAIPHEAMRVTVGTGPAAYSASLLNISAMSYGSLSANAIRSLNKGAKAGGFFHDTGEGGVSPYHREFGGDLVWELGSGYFGARAADGSFDPARFAAAAADPQIRMVELKLSQGAKPGHGGVLPAAKVTEEISRIRGVPMGQDCNSPAQHSCFSTPSACWNSWQGCGNCRAASPPGSSCASATSGNSWRSARRCWKPASPPTSSSSTGRKAAPGPPRWSSWTMSECRSAMD